MSTASRCASSASRSPVFLRWGCTEFFLNRLIRVPLFGIITLHTRGIIYYASVMFGTTLQFEDVRQKALSS